MEYASPTLIIILMAMFINILGSTSVPFVVLHGIGQKCTDKKVSHLTDTLASLSNSQGYCLESSYGRLNSWFLPLQDQASIVCSKVKEMKELQMGYHLVGLSQGNIIGRAVIEYCDGAPPVKNFVSLAGPHAGTASSPYCTFKIFCFVSARILNLAIYTKFIQNHLAASGYFKFPFNVPTYLKKSKFLAQLNNEPPAQRNSTYKERFMSLENLALIMFENDKVLVPKQTSWFGYFPDMTDNNTVSQVLPPQQTSLYIEDWIGLKALDEAGRVKYISVPGNHLGISDDDMKKYIVPYLRNDDFGGSKRTSDSKKMNTHVGTYAEANHTVKEMSTNVVKTTPYDDTEVRHEKRTTSKKVVKTTTMRYDSTKVRNKKVVKIVTRYRHTKVKLEESKMSTQEVKSKTTIYDSTDVRSEESKMPTQVVNTKTRRHDSNEEFEECVMSTQVINTTTMIQYDPTELEYGKGSKSMQVVPHLKSKNISKVNLDKDTVSDKKNDDAIALCMAYNWRPTMLQVKRQCHEQVRIIRR